MLETLMIAGERKGYVFTDRGTFIKYEDSRKDQADLAIIVEGDASLKNQYSVMAVNPAKWENIRYDLAVQYIDWLISPSTQKAIGRVSASREAALLSQRRSLNGGLSKFHRIKKAPDRGLFLVSDSCVRTSRPRA